MSNNKTVSLRFYSDKECSPSNQLGFTSTGVTDPTIKARLADVANLVRARPEIAGRSVPAGEDPQPGQVITVYMRVWESDGSAAERARKGFSLEGIEMPDVDDDIV